MKTACFMYISTDGQKRRGYSSPEQEERLLKYCHYNNIEVKGFTVKTSLPRISTDPNGKSYF